VRRNSPSGASHMPSTTKPASKSSDSTVSRVNFVLISVRRSSPAAKATSIPRSAMGTTWSSSERRRISMRPSSSFHSATC